MRRPDRVFEIIYAHDRRKHRHRCWACSRIVNEGERVLMLRQRRGSKVIHVEHADETGHANGDERLTWRELLIVHGRAIDYPQESAADQVRRARELAAQMRGDSWCPYCGHDDHEFVPFRDRCGVENCPCVGGH